MDDELVEQTEFIDLILTSATNDVGTFTGFSQTAIILISDDDGNDYLYQHCNGSDLLTTFCLQLLSSSSPNHLIMSVRTAEQSLFAWS